MTDIGTVLEVLNAERYGPSPWWSHREEIPELDDSNMSTGRRRRALAGDFDRAAERAKGSAA